MADVGVFGGTFNPIHNGHLHLCQTLMQKAGLKKVLLMPVNTPPHKIAHGLLDNDTRLQMCRLAVHDQALIQVSDLECRRQGKSYTVDTIDALQALYPNDRLVLIMGSDMYLTLPEWKDYQRLVKSCKIIAAAREEHLGQSLQKMQAHILSIGGDTQVYPMDVLPISSTQIRRMLEEKDPKAANYLPKAVYAYILQHKLYQKGE